MARLPVAPPPGFVIKLRGRIQIVSDRGIIVAKRWPRPRPGRGTPAQAAARQAFRDWVAALKQIDPIEIENARVLAYNSGYTWRDVISRASLGKMIEWDLVQGAEMPEFNVQGMLDQLGLVEGSMIVKAGGIWLLLPPGDPEQILQIDPTLMLPVWADNTASGINQLTGDASAGPGSGSQAVTLANTAVSPGSYTAANITVDAKGRITAAADSAIVGGINQLTGDATAGPGSGSQAVTLANTAVSPGTYTLTSLTVDAKGRVTSASNGSTSGTVTSGGGSIRLKSIFTPVGNPTGTAENDLMTYTLPANTLDTDGKTIRIKASGTYAANSNLKTIKLYFGSSVFSVGQNSSIINAWSLEAEITRTSSGNQIVQARMFWWASTANANYQSFRAAMTQTDTGTIAIKTTGQVNVSGTNQIISEYLSIELLQAA